MRLPGARRPTSASRGGTPIFNFASGDLGSSDIAPDCEHARPVASVQVGPFESEIQERDLFVGLIPIPRHTNGRREHYGVGALDPKLIAALGLLLI